MKELLMDSMVYLPEIIGALFFAIIYIFVKPKGTKTREQATKEKIEKLSAKGKKALEKAEKYAEQVKKLKEEKEESNVRSNE